MRGCPQCNGQWLVSAFASWEDWDEFLETAASHPLGGVALDPLSVHPGWENNRALLLEEIPMTEKTTPGISKCFDPGLVTREEGGRRASKLI